MLTRVAVITVTYGDRWKYLFQVITKVIEEPFLSKLIIVDNGSCNTGEISSFVKKYGDRIVVLRQEVNLGSAGGFAAGLEYVRSLEIDFVLILDDDNVPEKDIIQKFLTISESFETKKIVLVANRPNLNNFEEYFYKPRMLDTSPRNTFFEVFSFKKIQHFIAVFFSLSKKKKISRDFIPIAPNESFVYGGSFIPISAVRDAPLPDSSLVLYGDDIEYSWGIKKLGYESYVCADVKVYDVDLTFNGESHISGLFDKKTKAFKVFFRIRNMVRISIRNSHQNKIVLFLSILIWVIGLFFLGLFKYGINKNYFNRVILIIKAVYCGYILDAKMPDEALLA